MATELETLEARFLTLPGAILGHGPLHPTDPRPEAGAGIEWLSGRCGFLRGHADYMKFLMAFSGGAAAGARVDGPGICDDDYLYVSLYGVGDANEHFLELADSEIVDERGLFGFCEVHYRYRPHEDGRDIFQGVLAAEFCLDATGSRVPGIYVECLLDGSGELGTAEPVRFCDSFTRWFEQLIDHRGRIPTMDWVREHRREDA